MPTEACELNRSFSLRGAKGDTHIKEVLKVSSYQTESFFLIYVGLKELKEECFLMIWLSVAE